MRITKKILESGTEHFLGQFLKKYYYLYDDQVKGDKLEGTRWFKYDRD